MDGYIADKCNISEPEVVDTLEALDIGWQAFFITLYSMVSVLALIENLVVIVVQLMGKNFEPILRKCLINLSVADICTGVLSVPFQYTDFMLGRWVFPHFLCPVSYFISILSVYVTCHTLTLISLERYLCVVHPIFHSNHFRRIHWFTGKLLIVGWIVGSLLSGVLLMYCELKRFEWKHNTYYDCRLMFPENSGLDKTYVLVQSVLVFIVPILLHTIFYTSIALKLKSMRGTVSMDKIKIIKMLALMVISFLVCWLPIRLFFLFITFNKDLLDLNTRTAYHIYVFTYFGAHFLAMFNSCINPIIYCFTSKGFRDDFYHLLDKFRARSLTKDENNEILGEPSL